MNTNKLSNIYIYIPKYYFGLELAGGTGGLFFVGTIGLEVAEGTGGLFFGGTIGLEVAEGTGGLFFGGNNGFEIAEGTGGLFFGGNNGDIRIFDSSSERDGESIGDLIGLSSDNNGP